MAGDATSSDVLVIGAGIIGATVALRAALSGRTVTLLAPTDAMTATAAAGAMLGAIGEITAEPHGPRDRLALELRLRAADRWPQWHEEIATLAVPPPLRRGTFVTASAGRPRDLAAMQAMERVAETARLPLERVSPADVPGLRPAPGQEPARAAYAAEEGWIEAPRTLEAVLAAAHATQRVRRVDDVAVTLAHSADAIAGADTIQHGRVHAATVVVCTGARTGQLLASVDGMTDAVPAILPGKGVALCLEPPPRLLEPSSFTTAIRTPNREFACGLHVLPRADGVYLGATNRVTRWPGITGDVTASEVVRLVNTANRELFDDFTRWNITSTVHGERPLAVDGLPIVGPTPIDGLLVATGTYRNGVLLAPLVAELIVDHLDGGPGVPELHPGPSRLVETESPSALLSAGLADFAELLKDPDGPPPQPEIGLLLSTLGRLVLERSGEADALRAQVHDVLVELPVLELVPEAIIELCCPEFLP